MEVANKATPLPPYDGSRESVRKFLELMLNDPNIPDDVVIAAWPRPGMPGHQEFLASQPQLRTGPELPAGRRHRFAPATPTTPCCIIW